MIRSCGILGGPLRPVVLVARRRCCTCVGAATLEFIAGQALTFSKVHNAGTLHSKYSMALTFENFCKGMALHSLCMRACRLGGSAMLETFMASRGYASYSCVCV